MTEPHENISAEIADAFLRGWPIRALAAKYRRTELGIENILRHELDAARERAADAIEAAKGGQV